MNQSSDRDEPTIDSNDPAVPFSDWMLTDLVTLINDNLSSSGVEIGVTVSTAGGLVTGRIISGEAYFTLLREVLHVEVDDSVSEEEAGQAVIRNSFADYFGRYTDIYARAAEPETTDKDDDTVASTNRPTSFLHLRDVRFGPTFAAPTNGEVLWRGRLDQISGWTLSQFGPTGA